MTQCLCGKGTIVQYPGFLRERSTIISNVAILSLSFWIGLDQSVSSLVYLSVSRENLQVSLVLPVVVYVEKIRLQARYSQTSQVDQLVAFVVDVQGGHSSTFACSTYLRFLMSKTTPAATYTYTRHEKEKYRRS